MISEKLNFRMKMVLHPNKILFDILFSVYITQGFILMAVLGIFTYTIAKYLRKQYCIILMQVNKIFLKFTLGKN